MPFIDPDFALVEAAGFNEILYATAHYEAPYNMWFAWRQNHWTPLVCEWFTEQGLQPLDLRNGVFWTPDGSTIISLSMGSCLHAGPETDWELLVVVAEHDFSDGAICCHDSFDEAQRCAAWFAVTGYYCRTYQDVLDDGFED